MAIGVDCVKCRWAPFAVSTERERERELSKEGREVPSRVRLREGPIGVRITLGQPTIGFYPWVGFRPPAFVRLTFLKFLLCQ